ncbi:hypothetical protein Leryth_022089, partial [Lithospermum erythrorhizon]
PTPILPPYFPISTALTNHHNHHHRPHCPSPLPNTITTRRAPHHQIIETKNLK